MKSKYVKVIVPFIAVIASVCCMVAYRPPLPANPDIKVLKLSSPPPAHDKSIHDAGKN